MENFIFQLAAMAFDPLAPLSDLFGWLTRILYGFFGNYGVAIIMLTIIIRGLLIPLNVKSQKSMLKMQALSGKQAELQRKYGDDKEKYQEALMEMQKENGAGGLSGCLLPVIQIIFIWPIWRIVSGPLIYLSQISIENMESMIALAQKKELIANTVSATNHIGLIQVLNNNAPFMKECIDKGFIAMGQMIDLNFLGLDLTITPWNILSGNFTSPLMWLPYMILPILVLILNFGSMQLTKILKPGYKEEQEAKKRAKLNPARKDQAAVDSTTEQTMKMMNWMMPLLMVWTTFTLPSAMGLYWFVGGLMGIISQLIVYVLFSRPYEKKKAELEAKKDAVFKKKPALEAAGAGEEVSGKGKKNGKKKK
ncbi:MAG: membrane protein insertase YidC [Clostridiales bacterium]|jgi:YidC/Oxa1 family membrane protein insertase|nr:membrane protein insertase YidC [Clostridiales bacterium]